MQKIWKPIVIITGYRSKIALPYEISNYGEIRNSAGKILKPFIRGSRYGAYPCVDLYVYDGTRTRYRRDVHRLVALHFVPNLDNKPEVNHLDCDHNNYRSDNLEWCTREENEMHKRFMEGTGEFYHGQEGGCGG